MNGLNINTAGTLNNVAYLNQANIFTNTNTFSSATPIILSNTNPVVTLGAADAAGTLTVKDSAGSPNTLLSLVDNGTTATLSVDIINALSQLQVNGTNINPTETLENVASFMKPGITTLELYAIEYDFIRANGAIPTFYGYREYRFSSCISVNSEIVHGLPSKRVIKEGDIVSVDIGVTKNGWVGDSAYTFMVGEVDDEYENLLSITYDCLYAGIEMAIVGNRVGDISNAVQSLAQKHRYSVVRELVGHGVGKNLHEKPDVPNFGKKGSGPLIHAGLVIAIEPMINAGTKEVKQLRDGWTIVTADNKPSAHFEHTIAVIPEGPPQILSSFD